MANNVSITPGSGDSVAAEDISSVKYQKVKLVDATASSTSGTGIAANPLQVSLANTGANATAVKVDGSAVTQPVSGTFWQATQPVSAASLPLPSGASTEAKQPALGTAGTPSADVITVQGVTSMTALKVDGSGVTQPVSASSLPLPTGAATSAKQDTLDTSINTLLKPASTLAAVTSITNVVHVDDNGGSLTVDGNLGADLRVSSAAVTTSNPVPVCPPASGSLAVSNSTASNLKAEVVGTGTFAVQAAATLAAETTKVIGTVNVAAAQTIATTNAGTFAVQNNSTGKTLLTASGSCASSGNNTLIAAGTNKLKVFAFSLTTTSTTAVTCIFQSGASGTELWRVVLQAPTGVNVGANLAVTPPAWLFATASATLLNLNLSSGQTVHYSVAYYDEA